MWNRKRLPLRTSLIITSYNQARSLPLVLEAIARQSRSVDEIIIGDDGSKQPTLDVIERCWTQFNLPIKEVLTQPDQGFRKGLILNKAILRSTGQLLLFLDGDVVTPPHWVSEHLRSYRPMGYTVGAYRRLNLEQSTHLIRKGFGQLNWGDYPYNNFHRKRYLDDHIGIFLGRTSKPTLTGGNFSVDRGLLFGVNGFDERYAGFGGVDADLRNRLNNYGGRPTSRIFSTLALHLHHDVEAEEYDPRTPKNHLPRVKNYKPKSQSVYKSSKKNVWAVIGLTSHVEAGKVTVGEMQLANV